MPAGDTLARARFGPMLVFSLTAGALFAFIARRWGTWPAALAAGAWILQPHLFAHAHYATYDALLTSLWVGATLAFARAVEPVARPFRAAVEPASPRVAGAAPAARPPRSRANSRADRQSKPGTPPSGPQNLPDWPYVILFGLLFGWAADTKLTGWFLPLPFLLWTLLHRERRGFWTLAVGGVVALATLYAFNPPWWPAPIAGIERFFHSNLGRAETIRIPVLFLGRVVQTPKDSLPWYNTLVWTLFVTPVGFLAFAIAGAARALREARRAPFGILALANWAFLLLLRALPHTPGHDGVRQFLPAFGCLALLAGYGAAWAVERLGTAAKVAIVAAIAEGAIGIAAMMPVPLSYYSPLVGGLPGATRLGMEPTYYWDALSPEALDWLNRHTGPGEKVKFATEPTSWLYLRQAGKLRPNCFPWEPGRYVWYVLQNRPGGFSPLDRELVRTGTPAYVVSKWGVPLIWIYPFAEVERWQRAASGPASAS